MRTIVCMLVLALALLSPLPRAEAQGAPSVFDASRATGAERRVLQAALALTSDYIGFVDGDWGGMSARALAAWAERQGHDGPATLRDVGLLMADYEARLIREGWDALFLEETGVSLAFPHAVLSERAEGAAGFVAPDGSLAMYFAVTDARGANGLHDRALRQAAWGSEPYQVFAGGLAITAVDLPGGGRSYVRSLPVAAGVLTFTFRSERRRNDALALMAATLGPGRMQGLGIPRFGILAAARASLGDARGAALPPVSTAPRPDRAAPQDTEPRGMVTGTGFHVNASTLVTASHVVEACARITLEDGTPLGLIARDALLDLAVLTSPRPSPVWLRIDPEAAPRLGQTAHALGYPYRGLIEGGLTVTNGNVSSLGDPSNPRRRIMLSAPVQPGNSGGPLLSSAGDVLGVVVARLDDMAILDATGTIPQNMNFATPSDRLLDFLEDNRVSLADGTAPAFDMDDGLPPEVAEAVVIVVCH
jgi:S1-C subfamily serine protease